MKFRIDIKPLSQNQVYKRGTGKTLFMTEEGKAYKNFIGWVAKKAINSPERSSLRGKMFENPIVTLNFCFKLNKNGSKSRHDIDGAIKLTLDAMNGIVYEDDSLIEELHVFKNFSILAEYVMIRIFEKN